MLSEREFYPCKMLGATADIHRARGRKKTLSMPSPTDRNLTALPTKTVKPMRTDRGSRRTQ